MKRLLAYLLALCLIFGSTAALAGEVPGPITYPKSLRMSKAKATITNLYQKPGAVQLTATTVPAAHLLTDKNITWSCDDESIATVDQNGLVTGVGEGQTRVRASIQGKTKVLSVACLVTVKALRVSSIALSCQDLLLLDHTKSNEKSETIGAAILPATATFQQIAWTSSDESVATVSSSGVVTGLKAGQATITATTDNGRKKASATVRVRDTSGMTRIVISAGGDIVLGGDMVKKTDQRFRDIITKADGTLDFDYVLKNLKTVFEKDDLTILNLECPLKGRSGPRKEWRTYNFHGEPEYVNILKAGSVEVANVANNHINDFGTRAATKDILRNAGVIQSDNGFNISDNSTVVKGVRVGFVGYQTPRSYGDIRDSIKKAKNQGCDVVVVSFHFAEVPEHKHPIKSTQIKTARFAIDAGADLVVGHHPHVIQGIERYKGKYIFYGLGAVESSGPRFKYPNFIMQQTILVDPGTGYTEPQVPTVYPIFTSGAPQDVKKNNNCQPILLPRSDSRFDTVVSLINRYSTGGGMMPAPYNLP